MKVLICCWDGDADHAEGVAEMAAQCEGDHEIIVAKRSQDGHVMPFGIWVSGRGWPRSCSEQFIGSLNAIGLGQTVLMLEPDAVLTRPSALNELESEFEAYRAKWPRICVMGHWKTPPFTDLAPLEHYSGSSVYRTSPELLRALSRVRRHRAWDLDLFFYNRLQPDQGVNTYKIRCLWGRHKIDARTLTEFPDAALIHGDKTGGLRRHLMQTVFRMENPCPANSPTSCPSAPDADLSPAPTGGQPSPATFRAKGG